MAVTKFGTSNLFGKQKFNRLGQAADSVAASPFVFFNVEYLVVAGAGGGGANSYGGGGGAGGYRTSASYSAAKGTALTVTVGAGGAGAAGPTGGVGGTGIGSQAPIL